MRKWKLAAGATVASGVLAVGMFAAFTLTAKAGTVSAQGCSATGTAPETTALTCSATNDDHLYPESVYPITADYAHRRGDRRHRQPSCCLLVELSSCTEQSGNKLTGGTTTVETLPATRRQRLIATRNDSSDTDMGNVIDPTSCALDVTATVSGSSAPTATALQLEISVNQSAAATPTASPTPSATTSSPSTTTTTVKHYNNQVHGFAGTCLDDKGNSSSKRATVIIWTCNNTDQAQGWTYSGSELKIHGMCVNAKGNGKRGSQLILWTCNGSGNEIFSHRSNGEFVEKANGYKLCFDDPGYSKKNGTKPIMYQCNNGANQHFSKP